MPYYKIQQRIRTLSDNAVDFTDSGPSFSVDGIRFSQWEFNHGDGWLGDAWVADFEAEASDVLAFYNLFEQKLNKIIPRISLVNQTYIRYRPEPYLITREDKNFGFIFYVKDELPVGLMFMDEQKQALDMLMGIDLPEEFFWYWNDATNTTGYTAKILLMSAAIEALVKKPNGTKDYELRKRILGEDLDADIFRQNTGLRHRLSHGDYHSKSNDVTSNYVTKIHKKVIHYFNEEILKQDLLSEDVVSPQRNFTGNHSVGRFYLKPVNGEDTLNLRSIVNAYESSDNLLLEDYDYVHSPEIDNY